METVESTRPHRGCSGYLTVFLSLSLTVILSLLFALIEGARLGAIRMQAECVADTAAWSVLAEYHRELQQKYDLFYIDTSYMSPNAGLANTERHLKEYMDRNFEMKGGLTAFGKRDFTGLAAESVSVGDARFAADNHLASLRQQIFAYMSADPAGSVMAPFLEKADKFEGIDWDIEKWRKKKEENDAAMEEMLSRQDEETGTMPEVQPPDNPAKEADELRILPALMQTLPGETNISEAKTDVSRLISHRQIHTGSGKEAGNSHHYEKAGSLMMDQYIFEKFGRWRSENRESVLKYQIEYILFGQSSDRDNLEKMAEKLLILREAANCTYIFSDETKNAQADALALVLSVIVMTPELQEVLKTAILFGWSYFESVYDVRALLKGKRVPLMKNESTWKTSLRGIFLPDTEEDTEGEGFSYEDYLRVLLFSEGVEKKGLRMMDLMESEIRKTEGNENFRMDWCMDTYTLHAEVKSSFGYHFEIIKEVSYN